MNRMKRFVDRIGWVLFSALIGMLTGCTTYVEQPRTYRDYEPPPPREVDVPPPVAEREPAYVVIRTEDDFYQPLSPYGQWVIIGSYGRCWRPTRVDSDWRPYCNGHWLRTDAGCSWCSDEPWGWATYHYGRWDYSSQYGWYWVPERQWAPAWVSWHEGGGY